jgi:hypothetical protein
LGLLLLLLSLLCKTLGSALLGERPLQISASLGGRGVGGENKVCSVGKLDTSLLLELVRRLLSLGLVGRQILGGVAKGQLGSTDVTGVSNSLLVSTLSLGLEGKAARPLAGVALGAVVTVVDGVERFKRGDPADVAGVSGKSVMQAMAVDHVPDLAVLLDDLVVGDVLTHLVRFASREKGGKEGSTR